MRALQKGRGQTINEVTRWKTLAHGRHNLALYHFERRETLEDSTEINLRELETVIIKFLTKQRLLCASFRCSLRLLPCWELMLRKTPFVLNMLFCRIFTSLRKLLITSLQPAYFTATDELYFPFSQVKSSKPSKANIAGECAKQRCPLQFTSSIHP